MLAELLMVATLAAAAAPESVEIRPQVGPQEAALASPADIVIIGGAAGGGKTYALLMEPLRHLHNGKFGAVIFRRTYPNITKTGGMWDDAAELWPQLGGIPNENELSYRFRPSGMTVAFAHMQHAKNRFDWKGAQIPLIGFDQLEEFEEEQFWYLLSRNRSARAGVRPYVRATCNPVPDDDPTGGWLNKLIAWWWDPETGYAIPERSGVLRWFVRIDEKLEWADTAEDLQRAHPGSRPKSLTFIPALLSDNKILEEKDPGYRGWLMSLPLVDRERLLGGNWKIKPTAGLVFNRAWFKTTLRAMPTDVIAWVRYWDKAGTQDGGKYSAGVLMGKRPIGTYVIADIVRGRWSAHNRETVIKQTADADKLRGYVETWVEQEPGSGGKESAENTIRNLAGHVIHAERVTGDKVTRAGPLSSQAEAGNVELVQAQWNEAFLSEAQNFDGVSGVMDQIDGASGAFNKLAATVAPASATAESAAASAANYGSVRASYQRRGRLIGGRG